jgi:hypothetical protein
MTEEQIEIEWNNEREFLEGEIKHFVNMLFDHTGADRVTLPTKWNGKEYLLEIKVTRN